MFPSGNIEPLLKNENLTYIAQNYSSITILEYLVHRWMYSPNSRFLVQETFPKTLPRFVIILISLQRWQHRACNETKHFVSPHLIGPQLHSMTRRQTGAGSDFHFISYQHKVFEALSSLCACTKTM